MERHISITEDGSHTLIIPELDEQYHSTHGAVQEAYHVFIGAALEYFTTHHPQQKEISILEIGFGTGLNAFITMIEAHKSALHINYTSLEAYPLQAQEYEQLNYADTVPQGHHFTDKFLQLHHSQWEESVTIDQKFILTKRLMKFQDFSTKNLYDIIYFDAFSPRVQPDLWTKEIFGAMWDVLKTGGVLSTYCAKGSVRRAMQSVGFTVERLAGPPHKREMLRAVKH